MLEAFLKQQKYTDKEAIAILNSIEDKKSENSKKAKQLILRSQNISDYANIPTRLKEGELNQKTVAHPKLKNYDHSLEMVRKKFKHKDNIDDEIDYGEDADNSGIIQDDNFVANFKRSQGYDS